MAFENHLFRIILRLGSHYQKLSRMFRLTLNKANTRTNYALHLQLVCAGKNKVPVQCSIREKFSFQKENEILLFVPVK